MLKLTAMMFVGFGCWTTSIQAPNAKYYDNAGSTELSVISFNIVSSIRIDRDIRVIEVVRLNQCIAHEEVHQTL